MVEQSWSDEVNERPINRDWVKRNGVRVKSVPSLSLTNFTFRLV